MRGISIGHSHPKPCTGRKTLRRGRNNGEADNVILIDVDPDHFDNDVPESLPKKPGGSRILRKDKKWPFRTVIYIDDDESLDDNHSGIGVNDNDSFSNGATHSKKSFFESKEFKNAADSAGEECEFVQENTTPVRLSKCKRTYSGKASTRNVYGSSVNSEVDLSEKDSPDCELMEDSSGELQKQWEKAFFRRKKDKRNGVYDAKDCDDTSKDFKDNHHHNVRKESNSGQHEEAPFCSSTSKSSEENEAQSPFITKEDVNFGSAFFEGPTDEFSSQSELKTHMRNNQPDINERSHSGAEYPPFNFAEQQSSFESDVENDISNVRAKTDKFEENVIVSDKDMEHSQPCEPGATRSVKEKENLMSENSSFVKFSSLNDQVKDNATLSSNKVGTVSGDATFCKNSSLERDDPQHTQYGDDSQVVENFIINDREKLKETDEYKKAIEEEWASRQRALQIQAEEAQRLRQLRKRQKAESMRLLDMERRQKQRVEEIRETQKKDEENMNLKEVIRSEVRTRLKQLETTCHDMASLLHSLGINLATWPHPSPHEVQTAYKRALLTFHPDRALQSDIRQQVEAEEKFKLINRLKDKFSASLRQ